MSKKTIKIDKDKCIGCSLCINACQQDAIQLIDNKATMVREDYCDGLGNCLPVCPTNAISFEEDEKIKSISPTPTPCTMARKIERAETMTENSTSVLESKLQNWPVQIKLVPTNAEYYNGANLLITADCCAYAYADFHNKFIKNKITVIGCPKLDDTDYSEKLTEIIKNNNINSITIVKMEVPCCTGILNMAKTAIQNSGKIIPWQIVTVTRDGNLIEN